MNNLSIILNIILILLFASCGKQNDETLQFLTEGIEISNANISFFNEIIKVKTEEEYKMNPNKIKKYKVKMDSISAYSKKLNLLIENAEKDKANTEEITIKGLSKTVNKYKKILISYCPEKAKTIKMLLNHDRIFNKCEKLQLQIIKSRVNQAKYVVSENILRQFRVKIPLFKKSVTEVVVIPESNIIKQRKIFKADIFLAVIDTLYSFDVVIGNDTLKSKKGKAYYKIPVEKPGNYEFNGCLFYENKAVTDYKFNFKANYIVKSK